MPGLKLVPIIGGNTWYWESRDGCWTPLRSLTDAHLANIVRLLERKELVDRRDFSNIESLVPIYKEVMRRGIINKIDEIAEDSNARFSEVKPDDLVVIPIQTYNKLVPKITPKRQKKLEERLRAMVDEPAPKKEEPSTPTLRDLLEID